MTEEESSIFGEAPVAMVVELMRASRLFECDRIPTGCGVVVAVAVAVVVKSKAPPVIIGSAGPTDFTGVEPVATALMRCISSL